MPIKCNLLISVGELSARKNHQVVVKALNSINDNNIYYVIIGKGCLEYELKNLDNTGRLKLLGYRTDVVELLHCSDLFVFPSLQEGLPVALMEAISSGIAVICSRIRGNLDLFDGDLRRMFYPHDIDEVKKLIVRVLKKHNENRYATLSSIPTISFSDESIQKDMMAIYQSL